MKLLFKKLVKKVFQSLSLQSLHPHSATLRPHFPIVQAGTFWAVRAATGHKPSCLRSPCTGQSVVGRGQWCSAGREWWGCPLNITKRYHRLHRPATIHTHHHHQPTPPTTPTTLWGISVKRDPNWNAMVSLCSPGQSQTRIFMSIVGMRMDNETSPLHHDNICQRTNQDNKLPSLVPLIWC